MIVVVARCPHRGCHWMKSREYVPAPAAPVLPTRMVEEVVRSELGVHLQRHARR